jgi:heterodisulfide reductase subunit A-like polyferredoxin
LEGSVLVIGGGIAGIQTSLDLTDLGFKVYLVERNPSIGGRMAQFDRLFPANDCSLCILAPKMISVYRNPNIELLTLTEVKEMKGESGNFEVTVLKNPRYVDETKCRGCGDCAAKCPKVEAPNIFDMNLGKRKSVYSPFPQATPPVYSIDPDLCLYINREVCGVCEKVCKAGAIDYEQKPQELKLKVGAIVVATGFDILGEELPPKWGYNYENVVNGLEYERILCPTGPFGGQILRPSDQQIPEKIAFIQCAGSGYLEKSVPYCSRVCCMYTAKNAILTRQYYEDIQITIFRHNIRVFGKNFYEYTKTAQEEHDIKYNHASIKKIDEDPDTKDIIIHYEDLKTGEINKDFQADLVVLAAPLVPSKGAEELAKILGIKLDSNKFFKEASYFNKSLSTRKGIYLCGFCQGPMNISETVADASAVASHVATLLSSAKYTQIEEREVDILPKEDIIKITPRALVIGGGVAGMTAALNINNQGFETIIVEKEDQLGGNVNNINIIYPIRQKAEEFLNDLISKIEQSKSIQVYLKSKIENVTGSIGNYDISILDSNSDIQNIRVGTIIIATGSQEFKPRGLFQYKPSNKNILTQLELEQRLKSDNISWLDKIKHVTIVMCVYARYKGGLTYCSNVCCSNTIKNIDILKELKPELEINVLFRDLHLAKKEYEKISKERKKIAKYLRYNVENFPKITKINTAPEKYAIVLKKELNPNEDINFETDLIILSTPMIPAEGLKELADILNVPLDENGFFVEAHAKLRPLDFAAHGIFVCGCAQWPKNVQDTIAEANGAAGRASRFLSIKEISTTRLEFLSFMLSIECFFKDMIVNTDKCNGCGRCVEVCSFKAIYLTDTKKDFEDISIPVKKAVINSAICKGCGRCAATCRLKAIDARHYDFKQISAIIDPYFLESVKEEGSDEATIINS